MSQFRRFALCFFQRIGTLYIEASGKENPRSSSRNISVKPENMVTIGEVMIDEIPRSAGPESHRFPPRGLDTTKVHPRRSALGLPAQSSRSGTAAGREPRPNIAHCAADALVAGIHIDQPDFGEIATAVGFVAR